MGLPPFPKVSFSKNKYNPATLHCKRIALGVPKKMQLGPETHILPKVIESPVNVSGYTSGADVISSK